MEWIFIILKINLLKFAHCGANFFLILYSAVRAPVGTYFEVNGKQMFMGSDFVMFLFSVARSLFANKSALLCLTLGRRAASLVRV